MPTINNNDPPGNPPARVPPGRRREVVIIRGEAASTALTPSGDDSFTALLPPAPAQTPRPAPELALRRGERARTLFTGSGERYTVVTSRRAQRRRPGSPSQRAASPEPAATPEPTSSQPASAHNAERLSHPIQQSQNIDFHALAPPPPAVEITHGRDLAAEHAEYQAFRSTLDIAAPPGSSAFTTRLAWLNRNLPKHRLRVPGFSVERDTFGVPAALRQSAAWRGEWKVTFTGEDGSDFSGVTQDWLTQMLRGCTDVTNGILKGRGQDEAQLFLHPAMAGTLTQEKTQKLQLLGRLLGKAMTQRLPCPELQLAPRLLARLLGADVPRGLAGIAGIDRAVAKSLSDTLTWSEANLVTADLAFAAPDVSNPTGAETPLWPNEPGLTVNMLNREEFVTLKAQRILDSYDAAIDVFVQAFHEIIPQDLVSPFSVSELDHILGGERFVDAQDWQNHSWVSAPGLWVPTKDTSKHPDTARWFFEIVSEFSQDERKKLLWLVTDASAPPATGFAKLYPPFQVRIGDDVAARFGSHTCFNQLDLPKYAAKAELKADLETWLKSSGKFNAS